MLVRLANIRTTEMTTEEMNRLAHGVGDGWSNAGVGFLKALQYNWMVKVQNPLSVGSTTADDGSDVTFWGTTAASKMQWDKSADECIFDGADLWLKDSDQLEFGDSSDVVMEWTSTGAFAVQSAAAASSLLLGADSKLFNLTHKGTVTVGKSGTGHDVIFYGTTAAAKLHWDESEDELFLDGADLWLKDSDQLEFGDSSDVIMEWTSTGAFAVQSAAAASSLLLGADSKLFNTTLKGSLTVGKSTVGHDVIFYGTTAAATMTWDKSGDEMILDGADLWLKDSDQLEFGDASDVIMEWTSTGAFAVQSAAAASSLLLGATSKVFNTTLKGTLSVGEDTEGYDVTFYGTGSGATLLYDKSADELVITGGAIKVATAGEYLKMTNTTGTVSFQLDTTSTGLVVR